MLSDIEIAKAARMQDIGEVAARLGLAEDDIERYGKYKAKINVPARSAKRGKLVLVTAINPTASGEGKTTVSIGLADGMARLGRKVCLALREPSLGPVFGIKGGAAGGGYAQVVPMEDINLHFTGDLHAITAANNLLCAVLDNHIFRGNALEIDPEKVYFRRCLDMNDRSLRNVTVGKEGEGVEREEHFEITAASEVMAILCLATSLADLKRRLGGIIVGENKKGEYVFARDLGVEGAMCALLKDAIKPNLVQTLENTPALMHGGPFANIAHGCNSVTATKLGLKLADYCITEAGFGADLGAEKFLDIKCRVAGLKPACIVLVATIRALKYNGGVARTDLGSENVEALKKGIVNLKTHIENMHKYGVPVVVAINRFGTDTDAEITVIEDFCREMGVLVSLTEVFAKGGEGGKDLAEKVCATIAEKPSDYHPLYDTALSIPEKLETIAREIYRADGVTYTAAAKKAIAEIKDLGKDKLPVCVAKTQYSLSDNPSLLGKPEGFTLTVRDVRLSAGAGFVVALTGDIMTMPGLPKAPAAYNIDVDADGQISGLF